MADMPVKESGPPLAHLPYEEDDPKNLWNECIEFQKRWNNESKSPNVLKKMDDFRKTNVINLVWMSNKLEGTLPEGATESETRRSLCTMLDAPASTSDAERVRNQESPLRSRVSGRSNLQIEHRTDTNQQLLQHMEAYRRLETAVTAKDKLSEKLILETHGILMKGLENCGKPVTAGAYRQISVFADNHQFPDHHCVPINMPSIVSEYNSKFSDPAHDPYQLASWLLYEVISLHPFEDGNGRLCRLLWCYSLMRDGLPFPTALTSGHKKARKHYIDAVLKSRRPGIKNHPHLTSLTIVSIHNAWNKFNWDNDRKP